MKNDIHFVHNTNTILEQLQHFRADTNLVMTLALVAYFTGSNKHTVPDLHLNVNFTSFRAPDRFLLPPSLATETFSTNLSIRLLTEEGVVTTWQGVSNTGCNCTSMTHHCSHRSGIGKLLKQRGVEVMASLERKRVHPFVHDGTEGAAEAMSTKLKESRWHHLGDKCLTIR